MLSPKKFYLLAYNLACAAGWGYVLAVSLKHVVAAAVESSNLDPQAVYDDVEQVLQVVQTAAAMEVSCKGEGQKTQPIGGPCVLYFIANHPTRMLYRVSYDTLVLLVKSTSYHTHVMLVWT